MVNEEITYLNNQIKANWI